MATAAIVRSEDGLSAETIWTLALRESGAFGFGDSGWDDEGLRERLVSLVGWINQRGPYRADQLEGMERQMRGLLAGRMAIALDRRRFPAIAEEPIERPIFIIGFPRSGTTLLHALIAEDPALLSIRSWHIFTPSPPPGAGPVAAGRIAFSQRKIEAWMDFCPAQRAMHPYIDKGAYQLCEDEEIFSLDFRTMYPFHYWKVPLAEINAMLGGDPAGAMRFHREMLQHAQWNTGKTRWVCKGPSHQQQLDAIFATYPDATCVWAHRPLGEIYASNVALRAAVYDTISGQANDWVSQSAKIALGLRAGIDRLLANDLIDDPRVIHLPFRQVASDPLGTVASVYARAGLPLTEPARLAMQAWLDDPGNAVDRYGRYPYSYEAFGLDRDWIEELFRPYSERFGL